MIKIDVRSTLGQQAESLRRMSRELQDKAVAMALNKATAKGKTEMTRAITSEFSIKAGDVRPQLFVRKASAKGRKLVSQLQAFASRRKGRSLNLIHFMERKVTLAEAKRRAKSGTLNQIGFQIKKRGGVKRIEGAFIGNKGRTIFVRVPGTTMSSRSTYAGTKHAEEIKGVQTIDVPQMFNTRRLNGRVVRRIETEFQIEFGRAVQFLLRGSK